MTKERRLSKFAVKFTWRNTAIFGSTPNTMPRFQTMPKPFTSSLKRTEPKRAFPIEWVRDSFPALHTGDNFVFFDNGAGAQVPQVVLEAVQNHLLTRNVQRGGRYEKSQDVDATIQRARASVAI